MKNDDEETSPVSEVPASAVIAKDSEAVFDLPSPDVGAKVEMVFEIKPAEVEKALPPAPKPAPPPPEPEPEPEQTEWFGKEAFAKFLVGVSYPAPRERILALLRGKRALWWRDFPPIPLDELVGLSRSSVFYSEADVLATADPWLQCKPRGIIFTTQYRG